MPLVSQADFARAMGAARSTVAGWLKDRIIDGEAVVRDGSRVRIDVEKARAQLKNRRDVGQALGNGLHIRVDAPRPAVRSHVDRPPVDTGAPRERDALFAAPADPFARGVLAGALALAYRVPNDAAHAMIEAGAPLPVAYTAAKALEVAMREAVAELMSGLLPGEMFPLRYPADWNAGSVVPPPWATHAADVGEPVDMAAWEAWAAERQALNYPDG